MILKTGELAAEKSAFPSQKMYYILKYSKVANSYFKLIIFHNIAVYTRFLIK